MEIHHDANVAVTDDDFAAVIVASLAVADSDDDDVAVAVDKDVGIYDGAAAALLPPLRRPTMTRRWLGWRLHCSMRFVAAVAADIGNIVGGVDTKVFDFVAVGVVAVVLA